jgi:glycerol-3-phosphate acyltransferase PlsY
MGGMTIEQIIVFIVLPVAGYFLGSVPFAWVIGRAHGVDIRTVGSKNVGATNLGRTLGMKYFWQAFLLDGGKGLVPVLVGALLVRYFNARGIYLSGGEWSLAKLFKPENLHGIKGVTVVHDLLPSWAPLITGVTCLLGHVFPIWLKGLKGGKGVATGLGVALGFWPLFTLGGAVAGLFFVAMLMIYRYISLASMTASLVFVGMVAFLGGWDNRYVETYLPWRQRWPLIVVAGVFSLLIIVRHRGNIVRLVKGTEPRVGMRGNRK